jgi:hypothetical protein
MNKIKIYDIIFWASMLVIAIWIVLKMFGVINSPVWIEMIPYLSIIFAAGSFYQSVNSMKLDILDLKSRTNGIEREMIEVKTRVEFIS